jgi:hypothetical protein
MLEQLSCIINNQYKGQRLDYQLFEAFFMQLMEYKS